MGCTVVTSDAPRMDPKEDPDDVDQMRTLKLITEISTLPPNHSQIVLAEIEEMSLDPTANEDLDPYLSEDVERVSVRESTPNLTRGVEFSGLGTPEGHPSHGNGDFTQKSTSELRRKSPNPGSNSAQVDALSSQDVPLLPLLPPRIEPTQNASSEKGQMTASAEAAPVLPQRGHDAPSPELTRLQVPLLSQSLSSNETSIPTSSNSVSERAPSSEVFSNDGLLNPSNHPLPHSFSQLRASKDSREPTLLVPESSPHSLDQVGASKDSQEPNSMVPDSSPKASSKPRSPTKILGKRSLPPSGSESESESPPRTPRRSYNWQAWQSAHSKTARKHKRKRIAHLPPPPPPIFKLERSTAKPVLKTRSSSGPSALSTQIPPSSAKPVPQTRSSSGPSLFSSQNAPSSVKPSGRGNPFMTKTPTSTPHSSRAGTPSTPSHFNSTISRPNNEFLRECTQCFTVSTDWIQRAGYLAMQIKQHATNERDFMMNCNQLITMTVMEWSPQVLSDSIMDEALKLLYHHDRGVVGGLLSLKKVITFINDNDYFQSVDVQRHKDVYKWLEHAQAIVGSM